MKTASGHIQKAVTRRTSGSRWTALQQTTRISTRTHLVIQRRPDHAHDVLITSSVLIRIASLSSASLLNTPPSTPSFLSDTDSLGLLRKYGEMLLRRCISIASVTIFEKFGHTFGVLGIVVHGGISGLALKIPRLYHGSGQQ